MATLGLGTLPAISLTTTLSDKMVALRVAMAELEVAQNRKELFWSSCDRAGILSLDEFWDWYMEHPITRAYYTTLNQAQKAAESAFMTPPQSASDEELIMQAMNAYALIAPSAWVSLLSFLSGRLLTILLHSDGDQATF